jgi:hypothetical protein
VREVEKQLAVSALPLEQEVQLVFIATNALLKTLAACYAGIVDEINHKWIGIGFAKPLRMATLRAMEFQAQRLDLAYRVYARGSKSAWSELHRLYRIARSGGFATQKPQGVRASAEQIYLNALLLDFAEPTKRPGRTGAVRSISNATNSPSSKPAARKRRPVLDACFSSRTFRAGRSLVRTATPPSSRAISSCAAAGCWPSCRVRSAASKGVEPARRLRWRRASRATWR